MVSLPLQAAADLLYDVQVVEGVPHYSHFETLHQLPHTVTVLLSVTMDAAPQTTTLSGLLVLSAGLLSRGTAYSHLL